MSNAFTDYLDSQGTECRLTTHDTPQHNGVAESLNCQILEHTHAMLHHSRLPKNLWGEATCHAHPHVLLVTRRHTSDSSAPNPFYQAFPNGDKQYGFTTILAQNSKHACHCYYSGLDSPMVNTRNNAKITMRKASIYPYVFREWSNKSNQGR
jgi:hypothetical protein